MNTIILALAALLTGYTLYNIRCLQANIAAAKRSNIKYVVVPVFTFNPVWLITHRIWLRVLGYLPASWTDHWSIYLTPEFAWKQQYAPFADGCGALLVVSPGRIMMWVCDAEAVNQITTRRNDFPKPTEFYGSVDLFGKNVVSTEGSIWRHHRKITSPPFTEKNNLLVFQESIRQAQSMLTSWVGPTGENQKTVHQIAEDTMRLSLHVISRAGFGRSLKWPHEEAGVKVPEGHTLSYKDALHNLLENIIQVMLMPRALLSNSPFDKQKAANESFVEWGKYMNEMLEEKKSEIRAGSTQDGMDLMGALLRNSGATADSLSKGESARTLTDDEILGNAFVFILAGHETAANTIHYSLLYLALHTQSQRRLQAELTAGGFVDKPVEEWDYEHDLPKLFGGMPAAIMNEELRLIPPVIAIPKCTKTAQPLSIHDPSSKTPRRVIVPENTFINLMTVASHRDPAYWLAPGQANDLDEFRPERWLLHGHNGSNHHEKAGHGEKETDDTEYGGPGGADISASLLRPAKGSYYPFSEGPRACLGRRFAQVEILAVLAVIFKDWSVELAVDDLANGEGVSDEEVARMTVEEKKKTWEKAAQRARWLMKEGMGTIITIQIREGHVPLRFVRRGRERFFFD